MKVYRITLIHKNYELVVEKAQIDLWIISSSLIGVIEKFNKFKLDTDYKFQSIQLLGDVVE